MRLNVVNSMAVMFLLTVFGWADSPLAPYPVTKQIPVVDTYHGVEVTDPFRWLENFQNAETKSWSRTQNEYARNVLDSLSGVNELRTQVTEILSAKTVIYNSVSQRGNQFFAIKRQPPKQQPFIIAFDGLQEVDSARIVVDPNEIDPSGTTHVDWYKPSPDGKWLAVSMSSGGSEAGDLTIFDVDTGKAVHEPVAYVNSGTAGGALAWLADGSGFFYTKHFKVSPNDPDDHNVYQHVYLHKLGTPVSKDSYELGKGFPQIAEIQLALDEKSGRLLATVQKGDGGDFGHYLRSPDGNWQQFSSFGDGTKQVVFGNNDDLFAVTLSDAPRGRIARVAIESLDVSSAKTLVPESEDTIVSSGVAFWGETTVLPASDRLYVVYQLGGPSQVRAFDYDGNPLQSPDQLDVSAVHGLTLLDDEQLLFGNVSFTQPDAYYRFHPGDGQTHQTSLKTAATTTLDDVKVIREFTTSKDGTRIPLNILIPPGVERSGDVPCVVYGYGGYGINMEPRFRPLNRILMDRKVIYAVANIRGGGEYGEKWHSEGTRTNKQNVFDDFSACVKHMTSRGYSNPKKTSILGGSNGGLLMGALLTQHPRDVKAVVAMVGVYDMLRNELSPNGAFNVPEFGTVKNKDHFKALHAYSPYHNVKDGTKYPAVLFTTGENDPRVDPMQSRKMAARLQQATTSGLPVLLRTSANAGHGSGHSLTEQIEQSVDIYGFLFDQLGVN